VFFFTLCIAFHFCRPHFSALGVPMAEVKDSTDSRTSSHRLSDASITVEMENPALAKGSEIEGNDDAPHIKLTKAEKTGVFLLAFISGLSVFIKYATHFDSEAKILIDETYPNDPLGDSSCVVASAKDSTGIGFASHMSLDSSHWCPPNSDYILAKISLQGSENHLVHDSKLVALDAGAPFNKTSEGVLSWPYDTLEWGIWRVGSDKYFSNLAVGTAEGETVTNTVLSLKIIEDTMDNAMLLSTCYNPTEKAILEYRQVNIEDCTTCVSNGCTFENVNELNFPSAQCTANGLRFFMAESDSPTEYLNIHCKISSDQFFERASLAFLSVIGAYQATRIFSRRLILMLHGDCPSLQELVESIPS
jgi:hypothetical protein